MAADPVEGAGEEKAILKQYAGMLEGIRRMPKQLRPLARREARDWLRREFKGLKERRLIRRRASQNERRHIIRWINVLNRWPDGPNL